MPLKLQAITPKKPIVPIPRNELLVGLRKYGADVIHDVATYPPIMPWKSRMPTKGPRAGGKRTGSYKKHWSLENIPGQLGIEVSNRIPYAGFVGGYKGKGMKGERQTKVMAARGWPSITDVSQEKWRTHVGAIQAIFKRRR